VFGGGQEVQPEDGLVEVRVVQVIDGDTLVVQMPGHTEERLRLIGVDAPENSGTPEPLGLEAAAYAVERLAGRIVFLETDVERVDRHGRLLGYLWVERPALPPPGVQVPACRDELCQKLFNAQLLLDGYAQMMTVPPNVKYVEFFREFQREARESEQGLWRVAVDEEKYYVGNADTRRFHRPDCSGAADIAPRNLVRLGTRTAAFDAGYEPCRNCNP
jgi:micrococcal nuclease